MTCFFFSCNNAHVIANIFLVKLTFLHQFCQLCSILFSRLSTNQAQPCSASKFRWDRVYSRWYGFAAAAAKSLQSCPTLCDPIDGSPPGFPVPGILKARTLEWVAISFSNAWKWKVKVKSLSRVRLFTTPWTAAHQAPPPMGFSRQEYWSGVPSPSPQLLVPNPFLNTNSKVLTA